MALRNWKKRAAGWGLGACLVAVAPFVTGCTGDEKDDSKKAEPSRSSSASDSKPDAESPELSSGPGEGQGAGASSAKTAVTRWVAAVVENRPGKACEVMAMVPGSAPEAEPEAVGKCGNSPSEAKQAKEQLRHFHTALTPESPNKPPQIGVSGVRPSGSKATVGGDRITVDGQTLNSVVVSNSKGVDKGQVDVKLTVSQLEKRWYVTDLGLSVG
jgi:hypothetical protein